VQNLIDRLPPITLAGLPGINYNPTYAQLAHRPFFKIGASYKF